MSGPTTNHSPDNGRHESTAPVYRHVRPATMTWSLLLASALVLTGVVLGHAGAGQMARQQAQAELDGASLRLASRFDDIIEEASRVFAELGQALEPRCSDDELLAMRTQVFNARFLRDVGRIEKGVLHCSTALGRLERPYHGSPPDIMIRGGLGLKTDREVLAGEGTRTMVIEDRQFNALVDPGVVTDLAAAMETATLFLSSNSPAEPEWHPFHSSAAPGGNGLSSVRCSDRSGLCVMLHFPKDRLGAWQPQIRMAMAGFGGAAGFALFLVIFIALRQEDTPERRLRRALENDWIHTKYQPIIRLPDHCLIGFEALARWQDDNGDTLPAEEFIALAERTGLIGQVSERMIRTIGEELSPWLRRHPECVIAINVAPAELDDDALIDKLDRELIARGVNAAQVYIEITERTMVENAAAHARIEQLSRRGFKVYADDFGIGYCGLAYLNDMAVHGIKISHLFTAAVATDSPKAALVPRITELAREMGLDVVIEGVETQAQARSLTELEPILVQGWLYSRDIDIKELTRRFEDSLDLPHPD